MTPLRRKILKTTSTRLWTLTTKTLSVRRRTSINIEKGKLLSADL
jgi:DNA-binding XRE family transcriptional regulator